MWHRESYKCEKFNFGIFLVVVTRLLCVPEGPRDAQWLCGQGEFLQLEIVIFCGSLDTSGHETTIK